MRIIEALKFGFKNYANFSGRIPRSTFIFWYIGKTLIYLLFYGLAMLLSHMSHACTANHLCHTSEPWLGFSLILSVVFLFPSISMTVKRLHDTGLSGWWILYLTVFGILILFLPKEFIFIDFVVGLLFSYVLVFIKGQPGGDKYQDINSDIGSDIGTDEKPSSSLLGYPRRFIKSVKFAFSNCLSFSGRVPRSVCIDFCIFNGILIAFAAHFIPKYMFLLTLVLLLPRLSIGAKRFQDIGLSGWFYICISLFGSVFGLVTNFFTYHTFFPIISLNPNGLDHYEVIQKAFNAKHYILHYSTYGMLIVGAVGFLVCVFMKSKPDNKYGPNPLNNK